MYKCGTSSFAFSYIMNASVSRHKGQDNMAAAAGRYYGDGGRATKRQKTEDGGMTTVRVSYCMGSQCFAMLKYVRAYFCKSWIKLDKVTPSIISSLAKLKKPANLIR